MSMKTIFQWLRNNLSGPLREKAQTDLIRESEDVLSFYETDQLRFAIEWVLNNRNASDEMRSFWEGVISSFSTEEKQLNFQVDFEEFEKGYQMGIKYYLVKSKRSRKRKKKLSPTV